MTLTSILTVADGNLRREYSWRLTIRRYHGEVGGLSVDNVVPGEDACARVDGETSRSWADRECDRVSIILIGRHDSQGERIAHSDLHSMIIKNKDQNDDSNNDDYATL